MEMWKSQDLWDGTHGSHGGHVSERNQHGLPTERSGQILLSETYGSKSWNISTDRNGTDHSLEENYQRKCCRQLKPLVLQLEPNNFLWQPP